MKPISVALALFSAAAFAGPVDVSKSTQPPKDETYAFEQITASSAGALQVTVLEFHSKERCEDWLAMLQVLRFGVTAEIVTGTGGIPVHIGAVFSDCKRK